MLALTLQLVAFFHLLTPSCAAAAEPYDKEQLQVGCAKVKSEVKSVALHHLLLLCTMR